MRVCWFQLWSGRVRYSQCSQSAAPHWTQKNSVTQKVNSLTRPSMELMSLVRLQRRQFQPWENGETIVERFKDCRPRFSLFQHHGHTTKREKWERGGVDWCVSPHFVNFCPHTRTCSSFIGWGRLHGSRATRSLRFFVSLFLSPIAESVPSHTGISSFTRSSHFFLSL